VGGRVGVLVTEFGTSWPCFSCGVVRTEGVALLLGGRPELENDTEGGDRTGKLLVAFSMGCLSGESDLAAIEGTATSAWGGRADNCCCCDSPFTLGETWNIPLGGKLRCSPVRMGAEAGGDWLIVEYALDLLGD
jgi:hypothetical protein